MFITINSKMFDSSGNYTVTAQDLGAAPAVHPHVEADVTGITTALAAKAPKVHPHDMVTALKVGETSITSGDVTLIFSGNFTITKNANGSITVDYASVATNTIKEVRLTASRTVSLYLTDPVIGKNFQLYDKRAILNGTKGY